MILELTGELRLKNQICLWKIAIFRGFPSGVESEQIQQNLSRKVSLKASSNFPKHPNLCQKKQF